MTYGSGEKGAIVAWQDDGPPSGIRVQRVTPIGILDWAAPAMISTLNNQADISLINDGAGGAFIACYALNSRGEQVILAQKLNDSGGNVWGVDGKMLIETSGLVGTPQIISDGSGGIVVVWTDGRNLAPPDLNQFDIYAQRLNASGDFQYASGGIPICNAPGMQYLYFGNYRNYKTFFANSDGTAVVAWNDFRRDLKVPLTVSLTSEGDVYIQKFLMSNGSTSWLTNGIPATTAPSLQWYPDISSDNLGGAFVSFINYVGFPVPTGILAMAQRATDIDPTITSVATASSYVISGTSAAINNFGSDPRPTYGEAAYWANNLVSVDGNRVATPDVVSWAPKQIVVRGDESSGPHDISVLAYGATANYRVIIPGLGPVISEEYFGTTRYVAGDTVAGQFTIKAKVESPLGFDIGGIYYTVDGGALNEVPLSEYSATTKTFTHTHSSALADGLHNLSFYAKDAYNNYGPMDLLNVKVGGEPSLGPVPVYDGTTLIQIPYSVPATCKVRIRVYSPTGGVLWESDVTATPGYNEITWNGIDASGQRVGNGIYPLQMFVEGKLIKDRRYLVVSYSKP